MAVNMNCLIIGDETATGCARERVAKQAHALIDDENNVFVVVSFPISEITRDDALGLLIPVDMASTVNNHWTVELLKLATTLLEKRQQNRN